MQVSLGLFGESLVQRSILVCSDFAQHVYVNVTNLPTRQVNVLC